MNVILGAILLVIVLHGRTASIHPPAIVGQVGSRWPRLEGRRTQRLEYHTD